MFESPREASPGEQAPRILLDADAADQGFASPRTPVDSDQRRGLTYGRVMDAAVDEVHVLDYVRILYKRRGTVLTTFLVVFLSVLVYTFTATPLYEATIQILIEKESSNIVDFKQVLEQNQISDDYYQTQYRMLQSRSLARRTLDALELWDHPVINPPRDDGFTVGKLIAWPANAVAGWFGGEGETEAASPDETEAQSATIDRFLGDLTVTPIRGSRLVDVTFRSPDAALATTIANAVARGYIEQNLEFKFVSSKEATDWLGQQLAGQRQEVEVTEQALQRYREENDAVSLEERQNIVVQKLADLNGAVTRAKTERIQKEAAYNQIRAGQNDRAALETLPSIVANAFVQQQKTELANLQRQQAQQSDKLGPRHPDMQKLVLAIQNAEAKIQAEIAKVVQSLRNDYEQALAQERGLSVALEQQKGEALDLNRKGIEYGVLARDAAANRQMFDSLMQRMKETGVSGDLKTSNIRIVDEAEVPRSPASPNSSRNLLIGILGGSLLAFGFAFLFEYLDNRIKNPEEIRKHLGLPFLGIIPSLPNDTTVEPLINNGIPTNFAESFRTLRTNLLFSSAEEGSRSLTVTSTGPGEGKTVVASNIAMALAQTGQRVILIDADMRKPRVHHIFGKPQNPGLSNVLVGNAKASESVHNTTVPGLWVMPAGTHPPNPAELLGSKRFEDFLGSLKDHFDWVVVDTPPVMAVSDSSVVAHLTSGVLFVVGAEMTNHGAALRAVEQLGRARARFLGAVLNRVDLHHNAYYYSNYYRREYTDYYQAASS